VRISLTKNCVLKPHVDECASEQLLTDVVRDEQVRVESFVEQLNPIEQSAGRAG
jgi:hypothetical protein